MTKTTNTPTKGLTRDGEPRKRMKFDVPSTWIAERTGFTRTGIYRMRTEQDTRPPSLPRMQRMEDTLGWSRAAQLAALDAGKWIEEFERRVLDAYNADQAPEAPDA